MKICFLTENLNTGSGLGRYSREVINQMSKQPDVEFVVLTKKKSDYPFEKVVFQDSFKNIFCFFISILKIRKYIKKCDIIHCFDGYPYGLIGALANLGLNKKLVINGIGTYSVAPLEQGLKGVLLKWAYKQAIGIPCISSFVEKEILKRVELKNTQIVHMGVDFDKFQIANKINNGKEEKIILSVGGLKTRKGYHISIPAIARIKEKYPNLKYYIVGDQDIKSYFQKLKDIVKEKSLEDNVIFLEKISDKELIKLYYQSDLFLLTSVNVGCHFEGFGLVFLEAGACGIPVIGTSGCGIEDAIKHSFNGLLVPQNNIEETSKSILKILDSPSLSQKLGKNSKKLAKQTTWQKTIDKYLKIYEKDVFKQ